MERLNSSAKNLIDAAEKHLTNEQRNLLSLLVGSLQEYFSFLHIIISRLQDTAQQANSYMSKINQKDEQNGAVSEEKGRLLTSLTSLNRFVVLDNESFYLFADILLDKSMELVRRLFFRVDGVRWRSLREFIVSMNGDKEKKGKNIECLIKFFLEKKTDFENMQKSIGDHRDDMIVHKEAFRKRLAKGFSTTPDGLPRIAYGIFYPTGKEVFPTSSGDLKHLANEIEILLSDLFDYLAQLIRDGKIISEDVE